MENPCFLLPLPLVPASQGRFFAPRWCFSYTSALPIAPGSHFPLVANRGPELQLFSKVVFMFDLAKDQSTVNERAILRKLRVWIIALGAACLLAGIGVGAMLAGRPTGAQNEVQIAHAPEALSASFAEIARRV